MESISNYNKEIDDKEKALAALNKRQFELMLNNDAAGMEALDRDIAEAEKQRDMLKSQLGQVMGADVRGQRGNQLTAGNSGSYTDGMLHAYRNIGDGVRAEQERKDEAAAYQGMLHAYGNIGDGVKAEQERKDEADAFFGYKPEDYKEASEELEKAKKAVDTYKDILSQIKELTGKEPDEFITNIIDLKKYAEINENSVWGQAEKLLDKAYDETGYTYYEAIYQYEALLDGIGVENEASEPMPSPVPPPPPREEDIEKYEKDVADFENAHGIWQYGKYWGDIKELNEKMKDAGFVTPNSINCYTYKSEYDEKYYFMPDNDANNVLFSAFGYAPFGEDIAKLIVEVGTGNEYVGSDSLDTTDTLGLLENSSETVLKTLGKAANYVGAIKTTYDIGDTIINNSSEINQLTHEIFGSTIASRTREGCIAKYNIYYNITKKAIEEGVIDYDKTWYGDVDWKSIAWDYEKMQKVMDSTGIDFEFMKEYYK